MLKIDRLFSSVRVRQQNGGDDWDRTSDLLNANQTLSQLSYTPTINEDQYVSEVRGNLVILRIAVNFKVLILKNNSG
jgi:hypothetical protein